MKFTISTLEVPFAFFEDYIRLGGIKNHLDEYTKNWIKLEMSDPSRYKVFSNDDYCIVIETYPTYIIPEDGDYEERVEFDEVITYSFAETSEKQLKEEVLISIKLINKISLDSLIRFNDSSNILSFHAKSLEELIEGSENILTKFRYCENHLNSLKIYMEELFPATKGSLIVQNPITEIHNTPDYKVALVHEIFDFWKLKANNGKGPIIMEEKEHERLMALIIEMIKEEKVPRIDVKFNELPISKYLLTYCFYVLKKKIYGDKKGKLFFTQFLKNAFVDLEDYKEETFKRKFATRPGIAEKWYPKIILESMNE